MEIRECGAVTQPKLKKPSPSCIWKNAAARKCSELLKEEANGRIAPNDDPIDLILLKLSSVAGKLEDTYPTNSYGEFKEDIVNQARRF